MGILKIIGGAGTGKTTTLLNCMDKVIQTGIDPHEIGFVSFTRAARAEAVQRAAARFGVSPKALEQVGWFRTLHSVCYRQLSMAGMAGNLITEDKKDRDWLSGVMGEEIQTILDPDVPGSRKGRTDAETALSLWDLARSRLVPFRAVWERAVRCDPWTPDLVTCETLVAKYERAKDMDNRVDFTDLLSRYCGVICSFSDVQKGAYIWGEVPDVPVWFLDESQDQSPLSDLCARRMTSKAKWIYIVGDPFQAIYGFAGSDPGLFQSWTASQQILQQTYRCPKPILDLGEDILRRCSDYWDRGMIAAPHEGTVDRIPYESRWTEDLDPNDSWLLLGRTNFTAGRLCKRLNGSKIPWVSTRQGSKWDAPERNRAIMALDQLQKLGIVYAHDWKRILKYLPTKDAGHDLLVRGTKARWEKYDGSDDAVSQNVEDWGATPHLAAVIKSGGWRRLVDHAESLLEAVSRWGDDWVFAGPKITVSTIHGAKGMEADNVLLFTSTSRPVHESAQDAEGRNEELRLAYVGVTRARKRLLICEENVQYRMEVL